MRVPQAKSQPMKKDKVSWLPKQQVRAMAMADPPVAPRAIEEIILARSIKLTVFEGFGTAPEIAPIQIWFRRSSDVPSRRSDTELLKQTNGEPERYEISTPLGHEESEEEPPVDHHLLTSLESLVMNGVNTSII